MNRVGALIIFSACSVLALSAVAYIKYGTEDSTTRLVANPAFIAAKSEVTTLSTKVDKSLEYNSTNEKIAELSTKLNRLDEKVAALRQEAKLWLAVQPAASKKESEEETALGDPRTDPHALAEAEHQEQARVQSLANNFQSESMRNIEWSSRASSALEQAFASDRAVNAQVNDLQCRSRQCRVELTYQSNTDMDSLISWLPQQIGETLPSIAAHQVKQGDGSTTMVLYLFGEGYEPPHDGG
ncbi:MAG: hypothetical protein ACT4QB_02560 [Gammaproteobacteria bacterium]